MICPNCRRENADGSMFCGVCGARLEQPPVEQPFYAPYAQQPYPPYAQQPAKPKKPINKKLIGILCGAGAAVVLVVVLLIVLLGGGKGYETVAKNYVQACADGDWRAAEAYLYPELDEPITGRSPKEYVEYLEGLTDPRARIFGASLLGDRHQTDFEDSLERACDLSPRRVGDIYEVTVAITYHYDSGTNDDEQYITYINVNVAQIDGNWYVI